MPLGYLALGGPGLSLSGLGLFLFCGLSLLLGDLVGFGFLLFVRAGLRLLDLLWDVSQILAQLAALDPAQVDAAGLDFAELLQRLVELARVVQLLGCGVGLVGLVLALCSLLLLGHGFRLCGLVACGFLFVDLG